MNTAYSFTFSMNSRKRSSARRRWSSIALRSVRSSTTFTKPTRFFSSSRRAVVMLSAQKRVPSLCTCQRSSSDRPSAAALCSSSRGLSFSSGGKKRVKDWPTTSSPG